MAFRLLSVAAILSLGLTVAGAQTGTITGSVMDRVSAEPLPSANVLVVGTSLGASSDLDGNFIVSEVPVGTYQLRATLVGYEPVIVSDVVVASGRPVDIHIKMDQETIGLGEVEVTASYFRRTPEQAVSAQRLSFEEIRRSPGGFEDVVRAVAVFPGVAQVSAGRNDLIVRGGAPSENIYVVDNIEIPNINHFSTQGSGGGPLSYINLDFVRETSFSTGGFGVRYGDRLSSVLTIDLREGRTDRLGGKATISATQFGLNLEGPAGENGTFLVSARRSYLDLIFRASGFSFVPEYWDFFARGTYTIDRNNALTILGIGALDNVREFVDDAEDAYNNSRILADDQNQYAFGLSWRHLFGNGFMTVSLGRTFTHFDQRQADSLQNPVFTNTSKEGETSLRADFVLKVGDGLTELSGGVQGKLVRTNTSLLLPPFSTSFGDTLSADIEDAGDVSTKGSAYMQVSRRFADRLTLTVGARGEYFSRIEDPFAFAPRASMTYEFTRQTALTASVGMFHQSPSSIWLTANPVNTGLSHIRADQYVVGLEHYVRADTKVRVEGFLKDYRQYAASIDRPYLIMVNTGGGYGGSEDNFSSFGIDHLMSEGTGRAAGLEFLVQKKLSEIPLYGLLSVTVSSARFTALDGVERPGLYDQRVLANFSGGYKFDESWEASSRVRFATGRPYTPFNPDGTQDVSRYNSERFPSEAYVDVRVDRRWNFASWDLVVFLDIQNITNNKASGTIRWNDREQKVEFNESSIGILPSLGVSAEF
ncbi:MAG: TonB-dependent receptor plug [Bacteroidetes bacterium]|nr:TonB-dependent receptor plug [Bacteroidota bacterium]